MVDQRYLTAKPPPPSAIKQGFDQRVLPAAINAIGSVEVALEQLASGVRRTPVTSACIALGVGFLLAQSLARPAPWRYARGWRPSIG